MDKQLKAELVAMRSDIGTNLNSIEKLIASMDGKLSKILESNDDNPLQ
jgi:hypothetical protein